MPDDRIETARALFAGRSSGDPDALEQLTASDAVLHDVAAA